MSVDEFFRMARRGGGNEFEESGEEFEGDVKEILKERYAQIEGKKKALLLDNGMNVIREVYSGEIIYSMDKSRKKVLAVVIDGTATKVVIEICERAGVKHIGAKNFAAVETKVNLIGL